MYSKNFRIEIFFPVFVGEGIVYVAYTPGGDKPRINHCCNIYYVICNHGLICNIYYVVCNYGLMYKYVFDDNQSGYRLM